MLVYTVCAGCYGCTVPGMPTDDVIAAADEVDPGLGCVERLFGGDFIPFDIPWRDHVGGVMVKVSVSP